MPANLLLDSWGLPWPDVRFFQYPGAPPEQNGADLVGSGRPLLPTTNKPEGIGPMRLGYTILYVSDVRATIDFYERAFGVNRRMVKDGDYGELDTGTTVLAFAANNFARQITPVAFEAADLNSPAPPIEIGFVTEHIEADFNKALAAGAVEVKKPEQKPWGQTVSYLRDLNGFLIEICSPLD